MSPRGSGSKWRVTLVQETFSVFLGSFCLFYHRYLILIPQKCITFITGLVRQNQKDSKTDVQFCEAVWISVPISRTIQSNIFNTSSINASQSFLLAAIHAHVIIPPPWTSVVKVLRWVPFCGLPGLLNVIDFTYSLLSTQLLSSS